MATTYGVIERNGVNFSHDSAVSISYSNQTSGLTATNVQAALDELKSSIPTNLSDLSDDATHRFVTDTEKNTWNGKQDVLTQGSNITISNNTISATDHIYTVVTTASDGLCPTLSGSTDRYLRGDGTWGIPNIDTSDKNEKKSIKSLGNSAKDFIMELNPVSYKFKNGNSGRIHYGLVAQEVEDAMNKLGLTAMDFAGFCKDKKTITETQTTDEKDEYIYGLRYNEFIAPLIKTVQFQEERIDRLEKQLQTLQTS